MHNIQGITFETISQLICKIKSPTIKNVGFFPWPTIIPSAKANTVDNF